MFNGNKIYVIDKNGKKKRVLFIPGLNIRFKGKNSTVVVKQPIAPFNRCTIKLFNDCNFYMGITNRVVKNLKVFLNGDYGVCNIGDNFSCTNYCELHVGPEKGLKIEIGNDCMFGRDILIRATDGHEIIDASTGECLNKGKNVSIGNHVWLAEKVSVMKGCRVADNSVVGLKSIVTKSCDIPNSIYVGTPAKLVKTGINWRIEPPIEG